MNKILIVGQKIEYHTLLAHWWMKSAQTDHCQKRRLYHGIKGAAFTEQEKRDDAMSTAHRHIEIVAELQSALLQLFIDKEQA